MIIRPGASPSRVTLVAVALAILVTGCTTVPDRSAAADAVTNRVRALPGVLSVEGRYANGMVEGHSYTIDVRLDDGAELPRVLATVDAFYDGLAEGGFAQHSSRYLARIGNDLIQVFGTDQHRERPTDEVRRWFRLIEHVSGAVHWAVGPDPSTGIRSISVDLSDDDGLASTLSEMAAHAADLADRRWIIRWHRLRLDLMGAPYPSASMAATIEELTADGDWSVTYDPTADPTVTMAVWAPSPGSMESTARDHLPVVSRLGVPVRYTVRGGEVDPADVLVGGCLAGGTGLQRRLNAEFGEC